MSQLVMSSLGETFALNVLDMSMPIYEESQSAQVKSMQVHFPIRPAQPNVVFDVIFRNQVEFEDFQWFVRTHQRVATGAATGYQQLVTMLWPERNINNWTGTINSFVAGGMRWNYYPRARLEVDLVDSLVTRRTPYASIALAWQSIYGAVGALGTVTAMDEPTLTPQQLQQETGLIVDGGGQLIGSTTSPISLTDGLSAAAPISLGVPVTSGIAAGS